MSGGKLSSSASDIYVEFKNHEVDRAKKQAQKRDQMDLKTTQKTTQKMDLKMTQKTKSQKTRKKPLKTRDLKKIIPQKTEQMTQKMTQKTDLKTDLKILKLLVLNPNMTISELEKKINKSNRTITRAIHRLQQLGYLKRIGPDKGGHWEVVKKK